MRPQQAGRTLRWARLLRWAHPIDAPTATRIDTGCVSVLHYAPRGHNVTQTHSQYQYEWRWGQRSGAPTGEVHYYYSNRPSSSYIKSKNFLRRGQGLHTMGIPSPKHSQCGAAGRATIFSGPVYVDTGLRCVCTLQWLLPAGAGTWRLKLQFRAKGVWRKF